ncbi:DUF4922 domain-containing protein [Parabacteroides sp. OttesenSCG-928-G07]|nr:DUF4922 domain-containing protein [Parabacteroides sp. OttesenSCG-928-G21]MDL2277293.1 DUF4922 domain-containing protein [Parabacteroides sp. OttesenSCG-928-G07]
MKPNAWINSLQASDFLTKQLAAWPLAKQNYIALKSVYTKSVELKNFTIKIQCNPTRISSSCAKTEPTHIQERKCFLCLENQPTEQFRLFFGSHYYFLCNPYPIFPEHFTIVSRKHIDQQILSRIEDFLDLTKRLDKFTIFYNGPKSGASAPDHAHFQAVTRNSMPLDREWEQQMIRYGKSVWEENNGNIHTLENYLRNGFIIQAKTKKTAISLFEKIYACLHIEEGDMEPMMNIFGQYVDNSWVIIIIPRKKHRPKQFYATGDERLITSPGVADIGGVFITPREEDFNKITPDILEDIYTQICFDDSEITKFAEQLTVNQK